MSYMYGIYMLRFTLTEVVILSSQGAIVLSTDCPECGVKTMSPPWVNRHSRLTLVRQILSRFVSALEGEKVNAWSVTGPYGTGKSAFAAFLLSLCSGPSSQQGKVATDVLCKADRQLAGQPHGQHDAPRRAVEARGREFVEVHAVGIIAVTARTAWGVSTATTMFESRMASRICSSQACPPRISAWSSQQENRPVASRSALSRRAMSVASARP